MKHLNAIALFLFFTSPMWFTALLAISDDRNGVKRFNSFNEFKSEYKTEVKSGIKVILKVTSVRYDSFGNPIYEVCQDDDSGLELFDCQEVEIFGPDDLYVGQIIEL